VRTTVVSRTIMPFDVASTVVYAVSAKPMARRPGELREREEDFWNGGNQRHASRTRHVVRAMPSG